MNKERIYIGIFVFSLLLFAVFEWLKPKPINWDESYSGLDKIPFGCYIMRDMLPQLSPGQELSIQNEPIFTAEWDSTGSRNTIYINGSFTPDEFETDKLIRQAEAGHNIFIAANSVSGSLADTLGINIYQPLSFTQEDSAGVATDSVSLNFMNQQIRANKPWSFAVGISNRYFTDYDTAKTTVLGKTGHETNFIRIKQGKGSLFLHTMPQVFTNYHMQDKQKANYAFRALSYLPVQPTTWDEYNKLGRSTAGSPMRYIVSHEYLKWGWITALAGLFLFMIFRAKRRQRIIPEIQKPQNTSLQFTKTIGRLYFEHGNRKDIIRKKITYFLQYIRSRFRLDTQTFDQEFLDNLSGRTGIEKDAISELFEQISAIQDKPDLSSKELYSINKKIENFYQQTSR